MRVVSLLLFVVCSLMLLSLCIVCLCCGWSVRVVCCVLCVVCRVAFDVCSSLCLFCRLLFLGARLLFGVFSGQCGLSCGGCRWSRS